MPGRAVRAVEPRAVAHEVLVRVETTDAFADLLLADRLAAAGLDARDTALVTRLVYGTLAWQGRLDHRLRSFLKIPLERLDPPVRAALRLGLYQLAFLARVPAYAAVDASVRLAGRRAGGLVNAVLRRAATDPEALPDLPADPIARLAIECSHPEWLVARWATEFPPDELPALLAANNERGPTAVRANRLRATRAGVLDELAAAGVKATPGAWAPDAIVIARGAARLRALSAWREGRIAFQGEASQLVAPLLDVRGEAHVLDACAAPGGKAAHAATLVAPHGRVVALDVRASGAVRIRTEARRLGADAVTVVAADARRPPFRQRFDAVFVDAPCSGLGTLRRHPELRWRRQPADLARLATLQRELLAGVAPLVRPGGTLVYAVCTITREETDDVVRAFLGTERGFALDPLDGLPAALVGPDGCMRTLPHRHGLDGFFAARFRLDSRDRVR